MAAIPTVVSMQALSLYPIQKVKLQFGGYNIKFSGNVPNGAKVRLLIGSYANFIDITPHYLTAHLPALLDVLAKNDYWAKQIPRTVDCSVAAYFGNDMIPGSQSGVQPLPCPVKPVEVDHIGTIAALSELGDVTPSLNYVKDGPGFGRILTKPIDGRYYFALASILETDPGNRGFDCTTFVGSALGRHDGMGGNSAEFANSVGATVEPLKNAHINDIREFMEENPVGAYLMFNYHHIVTLINGVVREFNIPKGQPGYRETDINDWHSTDTAVTYTLRELPESFL
jgi:hypothetical protein